jgi:hypothetical protein
MYLICPRCRSEHVDIRNYAKTTGSIIGALAGATSIAAGILRGAEMGAIGGMLIGPLGSIAGGIGGGIAGAIIGGLLGGSAGGATGAKLGEFVDDNILRNYRCLACKYTFSKRQVGPYPVEGFPQAGDFRMPAHDHLHGFGLDHGDDHESGHP